MTTDAKRQFLRHAVATLAYRAEKAIRNAPPAFGPLRAGDATRTAEAVLAHIGSLLEWALSMAEGKHGYRSPPPQLWEAEVERFFVVIRRFDDYLASDAPLGAPAEKLFQGPVADALTHVGQIATLRRLAGAGVRGENYFKAEISIGRVGRDQSSNRVEFD